MPKNRPLRRRGIGVLVLVAMAASLLIPGPAERAQAIPVFARKYQTSCITCHEIFPKLNPVGEAFRRNGYQFPSDEDTLVKEEPVKLGTEGYKQMFPRAIWPSTLPSIPPFSVFALGQNIVHLTPHGQQKTWDLVMPSDIEVVGAGTFGKDISCFYDLAFSPATGVSVGRVFTQFSNLFSWDDEDDADGTRRANWCRVLPPRALNLRVGKIDPGILPHLITEESVAQFAPLATNTFTLGQTGFILFAEQPAIEISGIIKQYWSYTVGIANGGSAVLLPQDDNTFKDVYFRVARKWFGYPLDGRLGQVRPCRAEAQTNPASDNQDDQEPPGMDYWRWVGFETGVYGWFGKSNVPLTPATGVPYDPNNPSTFAKDYFQRIGLDARLQWLNLDLYGVAFFGHDPFPGFFQNAMVAKPTDHAGFLLEADYQWNAWAMCFLRYEQVKIFNPGFADEEQARVVPGIVLAIRQNIRLSSEVYINTGKSIPPNPSIPESTTQWITTLWWAF